MKKLLEWVLPLLFCAAFVYGRVVTYGAMNDSVAVQDTESYFAAAKADPFSLEFFEQQRSATLPLFIRLLNPSGEHELGALSEPYFETPARLSVQPGTEQIVEAQTLVSIGCWVLCALLIASGLNGAFSKALASLLILGFSFVPQIADWDCVLSSESLSFSLFALMLGLLSKMIPNGRSETFGTWLAAIVFLVVSALWLFTRDTNAYFIAITAMLLIVAVIVLWSRSGKLWISSLLTGFCLIGLFVFQQQTFRVSERWLLPLLNNLTANIFPYPERVEFFKENGMPDDPEILALSGSAEYNNIYENENFMHWARRAGMETYQKFLLSMPLWCVVQTMENLDSFFEENLQPFFYGSDQEKPHWADSYGNLLHPLSASVIFIDALLIGLLALKALRGESHADSRFFWFLLMLFLGSGVLMVIAYFGEVRSIWRHVLGGVTGLRLTLWLSLAALFSAPEESAEKKVNPADHSPDASI